VNPGVESREGGHLKHKGMEAVGQSGIGVQGWGKGSVPVLLHVLWD